MPKGPGALSKLYNGIISAVDKVVPDLLLPVWQSPVGPRTVFFWAPAFKWTLAVAGLSDTINRPASSISLNQSGSLAITCLIWTRYAVVITPKNYNYLGANVAIFLVQSYLIIKHLRWRNENARNFLHSKDI
ncbi:mitochondrial pyruvate carrier 2-like [Drosophila elegans]|uniref:mitochondrial pyruvate carrier 2-like n=1 Tax=Drosophila elegans TaxID=30023 RepID=UPI0007E7B601|nr:mitochondrial pyruvate carrier 2-like [Drosophila elegans]